MLLVAHAQASYERKSCRCLYFRMHSCLQGWGFLLCSLLFLALQYQNCSSTLFFTFLCLHTVEDF